MKKQLGWMLAVAALVTLLGGCAATGKDDGCAYPNPYSCR